ncbi:MAG: DNA methyltransferase [Candidatus Methanomethyliaceae archaeon]
MEKYFEDDNFILLLGDSIELMKSFKSSMFDMIFADPPYFLSNDGITCSSGKMVSVNKGDWDKSKGLNHIHSFNIKWLAECKRILKPNGTIWVSGTYHNIYSIGFAMQMLGYIILNNITWYKKNAPPNLSCRYFTHSTETILWAKKDKKSKHYFNYQRMKEENNNKQMRDIWEIPAINKSEKKFGRFPTQKPIKLLERIILASTNEGDLILDPFNGSGTTGIVAKQLNRRYIGIDINKDYLELTIKRYKGIFLDKKKDDLLY